MPARAGAAAMALRVCNIPSKAAMPFLGIASTVCKVQWRYNLHLLNTYLGTAISVEKKRDDRDEWSCTDTSGEQEKENRVELTAGPEVFSMMSVIKQTKSNAEKRPQSLS
ncbi:unnamed protein product [Urochloa humidicola]